MVTEMIIDAAPLTLAKGKEHRQGQEEIEGNHDHPMSPLGCSGLSQVSLSAAIQSKIKPSQFCRSQFCIKLLVTFMVIRQCLH